MIRKILLLALVACAGVFAAIRRRKSKDEDIDLWHEATTAPDLR